MPVLKYRNPADGAWVDLSTSGPAGAMGAPGAVGPEGPTQVSSDLGNSAVLGTDQLIYVPTVDTSFTQADADLLYLKLAGGSMVGMLSVNAPTSSGHAATKAYVDSQLTSVAKVTISSSAPASPKTGDIWIAP